MNQVILAIDGTKVTKVIAIALHSSIATEALRSALAAVRCATYMNNTNLRPKSSKVSTEAAMLRAHDMGIGCIVGPCQ